MHWITVPTEFSDNGDELAINEDGVSFAITVADILKLVSATTKVPPV